MTQTPPDDDAPQSDVHFLVYWDILRRRWAIVLAAFVAVTTVATVRTLMTRNVYRAASQILIEHEAPKVLSFNEVNNAEAGSDDYYQTQYKLLQSRTLARRVIESQSLLQDPEFGGPRSPQEVQATLEAKPGQSPVMEGAIDSLLGRLHVDPVKNSRIVMVSFESFRPEMTARVANELSKKYIEQTLEFRYQTSSEAAQWLRGQIDEQRKKVEEAEQSLQKVREKDGVVNIEERRTLLGQKLASMGATLNTLKTDRLQKEASYQQMRGTSNPDELPEVMASPIVQSLRGDLTNLERQQAALLERYLDQHPEVVKVREQIQETRKRIAAEAQHVIRSKENEYKSAYAQEAKISEAIETTKNEIQELSQRALQYDTLKREMDASKEVLNSLISRVKQTDVDKELKSSNIRIVDPAIVPRGPIRPNRQHDILMGILMGLGLGVMLALFLEYLDNTVRTPEDVRLHLGAPLLGVIPEMESQNPGPVLLGPRPTGSFSEGYRVLRTALNYCWPEQGPRVLVVTSTAPGEGKTLTSINLALTLASADGNVLLVDGDLRKPQCHSLLKVQKRPGLSDVLVGQSKPSDAVQKVAGTGLSILTSGTRVPSPADLMTSQVLEGLLSGLRGYYSWIVIDSPPVAAVADALIVARAADGVVVVAGAEMVPRSGVRQTLDRITETGARILGIVLNRAQLRRYSYYYGGYYGHYYGRYYGRYYGADTQETEPRKVTPINRGSR